MRWTTKRPSVPGYYWLQFRNGTGETVGIMNTRLLRWSDRRLEEPA